MARRLDALLADAARPRRAHRALHPARAGRHPAVPPGDDDDLAVGLSRVLFPIVALLGVSGIVVGILNSYDQFTIPALTPVFWNLAIIVGLVIGVPHVDGESGKLYVYAGSILVGTVIQVLLPMPWLRGLDGRLRLVLDWRDPAVAASSS